MLFVNRPRCDALGRRLKQVERKSERERERERERASEQASVSGAFF